MKHALIRRKGNLIDVSADGASALPMSAYKLLFPYMRYRHVTHLYGDDVIVETDPDSGRKTTTRVLAEIRRLYRFDSRGRLLSGAGYIDRVYSTLTDAGYNVAIRDMTPERPGALDMHWDRVAAAKGRPFTPTEEEKTQLATIVMGGGRPPVELSRRVKQDEIIRAVARRITKRLGGVIKVPPGVGKSVMLAAYGLLMPQANIAIVVPGQDNFNKTLRHLTRFLPHVTGQGYGGKASKQSRVVVYSLDSAHHIRDDTDLILVDEGHKAMANRATESFMTVAPNALRFTFTATPTGRIDKADARMEGMFGPVIYEMSWPEAVALHLIVSIEVRMISGEGWANPLNGLKPHQRENPFLRKKVGIWHNDQRNEAFANFAIKHADKDEQVLFMVDKIEHALVVAKLLPEFELVYGQQDIDYFEKFRKKGLIDTDFVPVSAEKRENMRLAFESGKLRHVIATDVWATGVSFDSLQVMLRADARSSEILDEQIPGRSSRVHDESGKEVGILYDCDDCWDNGFGGGGKSRKRNYRSREWQIITVGRTSNLAQ